MDIDIGASSAPIGEGQNYGVKVLYDGGAEAIVDIVFVHGLTGNAYSTWLHKDKDIRVHWPSELLEQDLPDARIMSFGYDADIVNLWNPRSHSPLTGHAENMVGALLRRRERTNTEDRRILFVGHSLGGLVIEHALSHSRKSVENYLRKIEQLTVGIVFLGVPHCGADLGAWESFGTQLANVVKRPNQDILGVLKPGSEMLHLVENDFHKILRLRKDEGSEISITCFYEELDVRPFGQIVPLHSAQIKGYPVYAIHANHMDMTKFPKRDDPGYDAILSELLRWKKTASTLDRKMPRQWMVPRSASRLYTGRGELGKRLAHAFSFDASSTPKQQRTFVIVGKGGTGKSELCLKFAEVHRGHYWGIFWLDARSTATLEQDYVRLGQQCNVAAPSVENVKSWLARNSQRWLVIIDNADDPETDYSGYIPSGMSGDILFTTRVPECETYNTVGSEKLDDLEPELARELLYRAADIAESLWKEKEEAALAIVTILGSHTLAIIQAGAFIKKGLCSLEQYPDVFKQQKGKLLKFHSKQSLSTYGNVYATFEVSAEYLQKSTSPEASDALDLLHIIAFMHNSGISETMFQRASEYASKLGNSEPKKGKESPWSLVSHIGRLPGYVQGWTSFQDHIRWREACTFLENLSIITVHKNDDSFAISMHSLIHAWAKERQDHQSQCRAWQAAATIIALSCEGRRDFQRFLRAIQAHVRACVDPEIEDYTRTLSDMEAAQMYFQFAYVLYRMSDFRSLDTLVKRIRLRLEDKFENDHEVALHIKTFTGRVHLAQWRHREAIDVYQDIAESHSRTLPDDDPVRLSSQGDLAAAYSQYGQLDKAIQLLEHVTRIEGMSLAEDHPSRLALQHELAYSYCENGQIIEAIQLFKHIVKIRETSLAEDHPSRLGSQHELARSYLKNGQIGEAIQLFEHVTRIEGTSLAEDHPKRLTSQHMLAYLYHENGQIIKAIRLFKHVVKIRETSLAEDHPYRLGSQYELARSYLKNGQIGEAIQLFEYVVKIQETSLAEDHPKRLTSQHELAYSYLENRQIIEAIQLFEYVVKIKGTSLAEDHPSQLTSQHELARSYLENGQIGEAIQLFEHVTRIEGTSLAEDHPKRLTSQRMLAYSYRENGQIIKAIQLFKHVVKIRETSLAEDHPDRLGSQHELARCYSDVGQSTKAIALLKHVVGVDKATLPFRLVSQRALARAYRENGQLDEAARVEGMFNSGA